MNNHDNDTFVFYTGEDTSHTKEMAVSDEEELEEALEEGKEAAPKK